MSVSLKSTLHFHTTKHIAEQNQHCFTCHLDSVLGDSWPLKSAMESRTSTANLKSWLCESVKNDSLCIKMPHNDIMVYLMSIKVNDESSFRFITVFQFVKRFYVRPFPISHVN